MVHMDNLNIMTTTHVEVRWVLTAVDHMATWARLKFKQKQSRSMVIRNGKFLMFKLSMEKKSNEVTSGSGSMIY